MCAERSFQLQFLSSSSSRRVVVRQLRTVIRWNTGMQRRRVMRVFEHVGDADCRRI